MSIPTRHSAFNVGEEVWVEVDEAKENVFLPSQVQGFDGKHVRVSVAGKEHVVPESALYGRFSIDPNHTHADITSLVHMNEPSILDNLCIRHEQNKPYTYTASVLLAMNPYTQIEGLYGDAECEKYRGKHIGALPPHPYAITDAAFRTLVREQKNQAMLISGESGAGKTETAKIVMEYLAYASGATSQLASQIQERVLQAQPILESFGNSATLRNSNSSRFGKYNRVFFDKAGALSDASITTYLLESSRVVVHGECERTYHVFYEMLAGADAENLKKLRLHAGSKYHMMHAHGMVPGFEERDKANFERLCKALHCVGLSEEEVQQTLQVLAGLVHLGDVPKNQQAGLAEAQRGEESDEDGDTQEVNDESVESAADLLGMDVDELFDLLKRRTIKVKGRTSMHKVPRTASQFRQTLHSFIKALYGRLFERMVKRINDSFGELRHGAQVQDVCQHIGILDIYGFERLKRNSFEQLCINLANERLQQFFVVNVLSAEQKVYEREGLPWAELALPDSTPVVNCINQTFKVLDDFSSRLAKGLPTGGDEKFCEKVTDEASKDSSARELLKKLRAPGGNRRSSAAPLPSLNEGFSVRHYAGQVDYSTQGWLDKNNDRLLPECEELIRESTNPLVKLLGEEDTRVTFRSISKKYVSDLEALLETLGTCNLHYIRCFKPNSEQKPKLFEKRLVLDQIVQCGTIELVKIMHDGYPNRCEFEMITTRFKALLPDKFKSLNMRTFVEALMQAYEIPEKDWKLGMSRLFLKAGQLQSLESMRSEGQMPKAENLERIVGAIIRKRWIRAIHAVQLCNWLPKFSQQIQVQRAAVRLRTVAFVVSCLAPRLEEAKVRVSEKRLAARRRFRGAMVAVRWATGAWRQMRTQRRESVATALHRAALLSIYLRPRVTKARACLAEAGARQQEERRREAERLRLEMERRLKEECQKMEEQRRQEEATRAEEERLREEQRQHMEERQRQEEDRVREECRIEKERISEERQRMEEERVRLEEARTAEDERKRKEEQHSIKSAQEEERLRFEEERRRFEDERRQLQEDRLRFEEHRRQSLQCPPMDASESLAAEIARADGASSRRPSVSTSAAGRAEPSDAGEYKKARASTVSAMASTVAPCDDDIGPMDSISSVAYGHAASTPEVQACVQREMHLKISELESTFMAKQNEVLEQMRALQEKNQELEQQVVENKRAEHQPSFTPQSADSLSATPDTMRKASRFSLATPPSATSESVSRSACRRTTRGPRNSIAHEALAQGLDPQTGPLFVERRWWAEQRAFLLEDLYPNGSPGAGTNRARRRMSTQAGPSNVVPPVPSRRRASMMDPEVQSLNRKFEEAEDGIAGGEVGMRG